ncbi:MAG: histidine phosphatase family protein [Candidatus Nanopelagicales bacterium]
MLWRHGRTQWNAEQRFQGHSDVPLDEVGLAQAKAAAPLLAAMNPSKIISSDLMRSKDSANELALLTGITPIEEPGVRETSGGAWEGLNRAELQASFGDDLKAWAAGSNLVPGGTGERRTDVAARVTAAIENHLVDVPDSGTLIVATHGGSARAALCAMLELDPASWGVFGVLGNCSWSVLLEGGSPGGSLTQVVAEPSEKYPDIPPTPKWRLESYNESVADFIR